jgi:hypothetical protein
MAPMISDVVVGMLIKFCLTARRAISECEEGRIVDSRTGSISESMAHNLSVAGVMVGASSSPHRYALSSSVVIFLTISRPIFL